MSGADISQKITLFIYCFKHANDSYSQYLTIIVWFNSIGNSEKTNVVR